MQSYLLTWVHKFQKQGIANRATGVNELMKVDLTFTSEWNFLLKDPMITTVLPKGYRVKISSCRFDDPMPVITNNCYPNSPPIFEMRFFRNPVKRNTRTKSSYRDSRIFTDAPDVGHNVSLVCGPGNHTFFGVYENPTFLVYWAFPLRRHAECFVKILLDIMK